MPADLEKGAQNDQVVMLQNPGRAALYDGKLDVGLIQNDEQGKFQQAEQVGVRQQ